VDQYKQQSLRLKDLLASQAKGSQDVLDELQGKLREVSETLRGANTTVALCKAKLNESKQQCEQQASQIGMIVSSWDWVQNVDASMPFRHTATSDPRSPKSN